MGHPPGPAGERVTDRVVAGRVAVDPVLMTHQDWALAPVDRSLNTAGIER